MAIETSRYKLPLLAVGQAQKEYTHNEALLLVDNLLNPSILSILDNPDTITDMTDAHQTAANESSNKTMAWLISNQPNGLWSQRANQIAIMKDNGFRYIEPLDGMRIFNAQSGCMMVYREGAWYMAPTLDAPSGGSVIDSQARESIAAILDNLQQFGLSRL